MDTEKRDPWFKTYPQNELADPRLHACSLAARGLYREVRNLMHVYGQPYGYLSFDGKKPMPLYRISPLLGHDLNKSRTKMHLTRLFDELVGAGLLSTTSDGVHFDPWLIEQRAQRELGRVNGSRGGNPKVKRSPDPLTDGLTDGLTPPVNQPIACGLTNELTTVVNPPLARARLSLSLLSSSSERESEGEEPVIPTVEEVVAFAQGPAGIPEDYARYYHAKCWENKRWLVRTARGIDLRDWRREMPRWWAKDRTGYVAPPGEKPSRRLDELEAELLRTKDPEARRQLRQAIREEKTKSKNEP